MSKDYGVVGHYPHPLNLGFAGVIDLVDETLREGAERAAISPSLEARCKLAIEITRTGVKSLSIGMFPLVPNSQELLRALLHLQRQGEIPADVRFLAISHLGHLLSQAVEEIQEIARGDRSVWLLGIHPVSDRQILHLLPSRPEEPGSRGLNLEGWTAASDLERRRRSLEWLDAYLPSLQGFEGGGVMIGLLDAFRANHGHLREVVSTVQLAGIEQIRLVDTAGTCTPHQLPRTVGDLTRSFPGTWFYGHFHDDFGMATANALLGLSLGLKGVDVSLSGLANRAGHPALAEVAMGLRQLYDVSLPGFAYERLYQLSREVEQLYGLLERPTQPITGVATHAVQVGIRTELVRKEPHIFDVVDPPEIGSSPIRMYGVRSGRDGLRRFIREHADQLDPSQVALPQEAVDQLYQMLDAEWKRRSAHSHRRLIDCINNYQEALSESFFTEDSLVAWLKSHNTSGERHAS